MVLPRVEVLSVGPAPAAQGTSVGHRCASERVAVRRPSQGLVLVTLAVPQDDAEQLIQLNEAGVPTWRC